MPPLTFYRYVAADSLLRPVNGGTALTMTPPEVDDYYGLPGARPPITTKPSAATTGPRFSATRSMTGAEARAAAMALTPDANGQRILSRVNITSGMSLLDGIAHSGLVFEDCTIEGGLYTVRAFAGSGQVNGPPDIWPEFRNCEISGGSSACLFGGYVRFLRCDMHRGTDIFKPGRAVEIWATYAHDTWHEAGSHCDVVQIVSNASGSLIHYNHFDGHNSPDSPDSPGSPSSGVLQTGTMTGFIGPVVWRGNWFNGGVYTIRSLNDPPYPLDYTFRDNKFGRDFTYGPIYQMSNTDFDSSNVWEDTGLPVDA